VSSCAELCQKLGTKITTDGSIYDDQWLHWHAENDDGFDYRPEVDRTRSFDDLKSPGSGMPIAESPRLQSKCSTNSLIIKDHRGNDLQSKDGKTLVTETEHVTGTWDLWFNGTQGNALYIVNTRWSKKTIEDREGVEKPTLFAPAPDQLLGEYQQWSILESSSGKFFIISWKGSYLESDSSGTIGKHGSRRQAVDRSKQFQEWSIATADGLPPCILPSKMYTKPARVPRDQGIQCYDISNNGVSAQHTPCLGESGNYRVPIFTDQLLIKMIPYLESHVEGVLLWSSHDESAYSQGFLDLMRKSRVAVLNSNACLPPGAEMYDYMSSIIHVPDIDYLSGPEELPAETTNFTWAKKLPEVRIRGASTGNNHDPNRNARIGIARLSKRIPELDGYLASLGTIVNSGMKADLEKEGIMRKSEGHDWMIMGRGIIDADGNANAWTACRWKMMSDSVVLKVRSRCHQWFYRLMTPWTHYIPVAGDLSDLKTQIDYVIDTANDEKLQKIAADSTALMKTMNLTGERRRIARLISQFFKEYDNRFFMRVL